MWDELWSTCTVQTTASRLMGDSLRGGGRKDKQPAIPRTVYKDDGRP